MAQNLSSLAIGAKVKFGRHSINGETPQEISWIVVAKSHSGYPANSVTLLSEKIIDLRMMDNPEPTNPNSERAQYGNNKYAYSNLFTWLNSDADEGKWYVDKTIYDAKPTTGTTPYANRPGFLKHFNEVERQALLTTTIFTVQANADSGGIDAEDCKVFIPSVREALGGTEDGTKWEYDVGLDAYITRQVKDYSQCSTKPSVVQKWHWWLRSAIKTRAADNETVEIYTDGQGVVQSRRSYRCSNTDYVGVRPALNLSSTVPVSDTTDSDGCYIVLLNTAPPAPSAINTPTTVYGGKSNSISWSKVIDREGDAVTYQLECSINGGTYTQIYSGASLSYAHLVPFGTPKVAYRVKASDPLGESSAYTSSATITVVNNNAPVISGTDSNLGVKSTGFTGTYTVTDANNNTVTVTEAIDGVRIRSLVATLGQAITYGVTDNTWLALPNGSHTLTISATDGIDTSVRTYVFTKLVDTLKIQNATPWEAIDKRPTRIMLVVTRNIPSTATFKVEVCNNGFDASPNWEDATDAVQSGLVHVFANTSCSTMVNGLPKWGVLVRVTVARNGATGACYVSAIGGNFE